MLVDELLLVLLDIALVSNADLSVHRHHDDFWLWSLETDKISSAWSIMQYFANQTGLEFNRDKTGYTLVRGVNSSTATDGSLPVKSLKWGLLELQADGTWKGSEQLLEDQADAMLRDLKKSKSLSFLSLVNLWNKYQAYLARNIGAPTPCTGIPHAKLYSSIIQQFQSLVLGDSTTITESLHQHFKVRFPQHAKYNLNGALLVWPIDLGGFQLHEHGLHSILYVRSSDLTNPHTEEPQPPAFERPTEHARLLYGRLKKAWESDWGRKAWKYRKYIHQPGDHPGTTDWIKYARDDGQPEDEAAPPMISESSYLRWSALNCNDWQEDYDRVKGMIEIYPSELELQAKRVYSPFLEVEFGRDAERLVTREFIPHHAVVDVVATARKMFSAD